MIIGYMISFLVGSFIGFVLMACLAINKNKEDKKIIIELICNEQTHMIIKDHTKYESDKYKKLEKLKIKIKDM